MAEMGLGRSLTPGVGFSNSGRAVKLSVNILAGCRVLCAVDTVITVNRHFDSPELF